MATTENPKKGKFLDNITGELTKKAETMKTFLAKTVSAGLDWINKNKNKVALMLAVPVAAVMLLISCENGTSNGVTPTPNPHELCGDNPCDECAGKSEPTKPEPGKTDAELAEQFENFAVACFSGQCGQTHTSVSGNINHVSNQFVYSGDNDGKNVVGGGQILANFGVSESISFSTPVVVSEKTAGRFSRVFDETDTMDIGDGKTVYDFILDIDGMDKQ